jgi:hypothetical protein
MKNAIQKLFILLIVQGFLITYVNAHQGGHNSKDIVFNRWNLNSGKTIRGNFSYGNDYFVFLEQPNGKLLSIPIETLTYQDQQLARFKIKRNNLLNETQQSTKKDTKLISFTNTLAIGLLFIVLAWFAFVLVQHLPIPKYKFNTLYFEVLIVAFLGFASLFAVKSIQKTIPKTSISFLDAAFQPYKPSIATKHDDNYYYVESNGIPAHNMMVGITRWQQQVPLPKQYTGTNAWSIPLQPEFAETPLSTKSNFMRGAVAIAVNGVPIFNALNNRGEDAYKIGELDNWGGHCGRADDYHYHAAPLHLSKTSGLLPIAFCLDGFPVYGNLEPDGTQMKALDSCNGHNGNNGTYHYHGTTTYPYVIGVLRGKVNIDESKPAPENQITPQAFTRPVRPSLTQLRNAVITDFKTIGTNAYLLTYSIGNNTGNVQYSWDESNHYTFTLTDILGKSVTTEYKR